MGAVIERDVYKNGSDRGPQFGSLYRFSTLSRERGPEKLILSFLRLLLHILSNECRQGFFFFYFSTAVVF